MHTPVSLRHARLVNFLHTLLTLFAEAKGIGEVHREVVAVRLSSRNVFLPDLAFFSSEQVPRMKETHVPFAPVWVCEALSSNTADRDVGPKFAAYEEHGVQEYWILDPETLAHRFSAREGEILVEFAKGDSRIRSHAIPGFWVERSWLNPASFCRWRRALSNFFPPDAGAYENAETRAGGTGRYSRVSESSSFCRLETEQKREGALAELGAKAGAFASVIYSG